MWKENVLLILILNRHRIWRMVDSLLVPSSIYHRNDRWWTMEDVKIIRFYHSIHLAKHHVGDLIWTDIDKRIRFICQFIQSLARGEKKNNLPISYWGTIMKMNILTYVNRTIVEISTVGKVSIDQISDRDHGAIESIRCRDLYSLWTSKKEGEARNSVKRTRTIHMRIVFN